MAKNLDLTAAINDFRWHSCSQDWSSWKILSLSFQFSLSQNTLLLISDLSQDLDSHLSFFENSGPTTSFPATQLDPTTVPGSILDVQRPNPNGRPLP